MSIYGTELNDGFVKNQKVDRGREVTPKGRLKRDLIDSGVITYGAFGSKKVNFEELGKFERSFNGVVNPGYSGKDEKNTRERLKQLEWLYSHPECCVVSRDFEAPVAEYVIKVNRSLIKLIEHIKDFNMRSPYKELELNRIRELLQKKFKSIIGGDVSVSYSEEKIINDWSNGRFDAEGSQNEQYLYFSPTVTNLKIGDNVRSVLGLSGLVRVGKGSEIREVSCKKPCFIISSIGGREVYDLDHLMSSLESGDRPFSQEVDELIAESKKRIEEANKGIMSGKMQDDRNRGSSSMSTKK